MPKVPLLLRVMDKATPLLMVIAVVACGYLLFHASATDAVSMGSGRRVFVIQRTTSPVTYFATCFALVGVMVFAVWALYTRRSQRGGPPAGKRRKETQASRSGSE